MNKGTFCSRKGGVTLRGRFPLTSKTIDSVVNKGGFIPSPRVSQILERQILRHAMKMEARQVKRSLKPEHFKSKKAASAERGKRLIELFVSGKIVSRSRRIKAFTLNPIAAARRAMSDQLN